VLVLELHSPSANDFRFQLQCAEKLSDGIATRGLFPKAQQSGFGVVRMLAMLIRKKANAMGELGEFTQAFPLFAKVASRFSISPKGTDRKARLIRRSLPPG
jgi:hypothetical protein